MNTLERGIVDVLRRHMPDILASSVWRRAQATIGVDEGRLELRELRRFVGALRAGLHLFAKTSDHTTICSAIEALEPHAEAPRTEKIELDLEQDISRARIIARDLAAQLGASAFAAQRAATAASELARNVVAYARPGWVELSPHPGPPATLSIIAVDRGPGIDDLERILSGRYRSKTGLGKGLAGVRRLSSKFDVVTGKQGTRVEALITLV